MRLLFTLLFCLAIAVPALAQPATPGDPIPAIVLRISGGDTIVVRANRKKVKIRLYGIDAPELNQPGGVEAKEALRHLRWETVTISKMGTDRYNQTVAIVTYMGQCINLALVANGHAWFYPKYCTAPWICGQIKLAEAKAKAEDIGLWADENPVPPWEWRKKQRR